MTRISSASVTVPIYLGDALQLRFRTGDMFAEHNVTIHVNDDQNTALVFPMSLVDRPEDFDALMGDVSEALEKDVHPFVALDDHNIEAGSTERAILEGTIDALQTLHKEGRNHIWAYYTRNLVRPVALSRGKVDVVIGNPPWLNYNQTVSTLRTELGAAEQRPLRHLGWRQIRRHTGRCRDCSLPAASTCI